MSCSDFAPGSGLMDPRPTASPPAPAVGNNGSSNNSNSSHMKTYVFVDEYNRHKRLKVMRACDGCRKRKIRCDGALQNGPWPCGACVRLKLKCVPPTLDGDEDQQQALDGFSSSYQYSFQGSPPIDPDAFADDSPPPHAAASQEWNMGGTQGAGMSTMGPTSAPAFPAAMDPTAAYPSHHVFPQHLNAPLDPMYPDDDFFTSTATSATSPSNQVPTPNQGRASAVSPSSGGDPDEVDATIREVSEQMGGLHIDLNSVPNYIANEKKMLAETPALEEPEMALPPSLSTDATLRIPPEMMPSEERALDYFGYYFDYVHPYVPVLNREKFYDQWRTARATISPLILEGIFACVTHYLEDPLEVRRWLALASKHEDGFKDAPRLSTVQGRMIILKAREAGARRGYYYRSWMDLKFTANMAIDLGLDEHYDQHRDGNNSCQLSRSECHVRTRIWNTLFLLEVFMGGTQGRSDYSVAIDTVDFSMPTPCPDVSDFDYQSSRRLSCFNRVIGLAKRSHNMWLEMRKNKDMALDPAFVQHNANIREWPHQLPPDMNLEYTTPDGPVALNGRHYVANMHIYYQLLVILHHRPQLQAMLEHRNPGFQRHMDDCNEAASIICRLQEALHRDFGLHGLQFMQRGLGFTIYGILTSTMLHLATITAPDAVTNARARMYFTRHMRLLEYCLPSARPELQPQINALREAFSQDLTKPFELRAGLSPRSPPRDNQSASPPFSQQDNRSAPSMETAEPWTNISNYTSSSRTASDASQYSTAFDDMSAQPGMPYPGTDFSIPTAMSSYPTAPIHLHQQPTSAPQQSGYALEQVNSNDRTTQIWDPSGIFSQWNAAFGQPPPPSSAGNGAVMPHQQQHQQQQQQRPAPTSNPIQQPRLSTPPASAMAPPPHPQTSPMHHPSATGYNQPLTPEMGMPTVTPVMWQDVFSSAYATGQGRKRNRQESVDMSMFNQYQDRRG